MTYSPETEANPLAGSRQLRHGNQGHRGGRRLLSPPNTPETSTASRTGRGGGARPQPVRTPGQDTRSSLDTGRQSRGADDGGQMTFLGGTTNYSKMDGEEARGGERGMHGRAKWQRHGARTGESRGGGERGDKVINGKQVNSDNLKARV